MKKLLWLLLSSELIHIHPRLETGEALVDATDAKALDNLFLNSNFEKEEVSPKTYREIEILAQQRFGYTPTDNESFLYRELSPNMVAIAKQAYIVTLNDSGSPTDIQFLCNESVRLAAGKDLKLIL